MTGLTIMARDITGKQISGRVLDKFTAIKPIVFKGDHLVDLHKQEQDLLPVVTLYLVRDPVGNIFQVLPADITDVEMLKETVPFTSIMDE